MKAYGLAHDGSYRNLIVTTHEDLRAATDWVKNNSKIAGEAIASADDFRVSGPGLVLLFNELVTIANERQDGSKMEPTARFTTKGDGQRRCFELLEELYITKAPEAAAPPKTESPAATNEEDDMASKKGKTKKAPRVKKEKVAKAPRVKKAPKEKKPRVHKDKVASTGGSASKATALELIGRANGATPSQIAEKLDVSLGTAKNLIWYLRRDGHKIVLGKKSGDERVYVLA